MTFLGDFHFIRPAWLLLLPVVVAVWWMVRQAQDPLGGWRAIMDRQLLDAMTVGEDGRNRWRGSVLLAGWTIAVIAIAGPTWRPEPSPFADDPVPVMLVLKAGESMDLADLIPSRMERARLKITDFASERKGQPLGLIAYAGTAHLVLPPTRDTQVVATMAAEISPAIMPRPGDDLVAALQLAERTLGEAGGSIVVLTDTVAESNTTALGDLRTKSRLPIHFLAVARDDTPEWAAVQSAAAELGATPTLMTPDDQDIRSLVKSTATAPVAVSETEEGTRWAEDGWWLVPVLAFLTLTAFRREDRSTAHAAASSVAQEDRS